MRLDKYIKEHFNLSREKAIDLIKLGHVSVNNKEVNKPAYQTTINDIIEVNNIFKYVSRSGLKLEDAIMSFSLDFNNKVIIDVGSSTGGFTQCSLNYGARKIYAYDVGQNQLDPSLRDNPKIELHEQTNILDVILKPADICLIDVSFTSVKPIISHIKDYCSLYVILFKPQFEVGKKNLFGGIVKNEIIVLEAISEFNDFLLENKFNVLGYKPTKLKGKKGNQEYLFIGERNVK